MLANACGFILPWFCPFTCLFLLILILFASGNCSRHCCLFWPPGVNWAAQSQHPPPGFQPAPLRQHSQTSEAHTQLEGEDTHTHTARG